MLVKRLGDFFLDEIQVTTAASVLSDREFSQDEEEDSQETADPICAGGIGGLQWPTDSGERHHGAFRHRKVRSARDGF